MKFYALILCSLCIVVFLGQTISPTFTDLIVLDKQAIPNFWKFISSIFAHGDLGHLLSNLIALALFGSILEKKIGGKNFLIIFFVGGLIANFFAFFFYNSSLGASGAIFGILGALVMLEPLLMVWAAGLPMPMVLAAFFWVLIDLGGLFSESNVGHIAHLTGILVGFIFGAILRKRYGSKISSNLVHLDENLMREWEEKNLKNY